MVDATLSTDDSAMGRLTPADVSGEFCVLDLSLTLSCLPSQLSFLFRVSVRHFCMWARVLIYLLVVNLDFSVFDCFSLVLYRVSYTVRLQDGSIPSVDSHCSILDLVLVDALASASCQFAVFVLIPSLC